MEGVKKQAVHRAVVVLNCLDPNTQEARQSDAPIESFRGREVNTKCVLKERCTTTGGVPDQIGTVDDVV